MKKCIARLVIVVLGLWPVHAAAQSAEQIIDRHVKAIGGARALREIKGVRYSGEVVRSGGDSTGTFLWQWMAPGSAYLEMRWGGEHFIEACNGRAAWRDSGNEGPRTLSGREQALERAAARYRNDRFQTYKKEKTRVQMRGKAVVGGRPAFAVEMTSRAGIQRTLYFDAQTNLLVKEEGDLGSGREEILFGDYRPVGSVKEPFRLEFRRGDAVFAVSVREVSHNPTWDNPLFDFPTRADRPMPDLGALLKEVEKNQEKIDKIREDYTYTLTANETEIDGQSRVKQKSENVYEVYTFYGGRIQKLVAKDGRPLNESERRKEQERVEKLITRNEKRHNEAQQNRQVREEKRRARKQHNEGDEDRDDDVKISDILRTMRIKNPHQERFRGKDVIVYEFAPNLDYKPKNRVESWVQKMAGMIWIDEEAKQVVRVEAEFLDSLKLGGGLLASIGRGTEFVAEQELVNQEVWLPRYTEVHVYARVLLLAGFKIHRVEHYSDYKKFNIESTSGIKAPKP